jgi:signal transduction histidine kinase
MTTFDGSLRRPPPSWRREGAVLATAFLCCLLGGAVHVDDTLGAPPATTYLVAVLSCAALPLRWHAPLVAVAATTACGMLVAPLGLLLTPLIVVPLTIAAYALAVLTEWQTAAAVLTPAVALVTAVTPFFGALSWYDATRLASVAAAVLIAGVLGHATRTRRAYLAAVEERAQRAEETRDLEARRRVAEERVHIARELHDLVAHQITLANAQAMVAANLFDSQPDQIRKTLDDIVETTRNALDDLRATVGLLRQTEGTTTSAEPAPGLGQLPLLVDSFRRAGLEVTVHEEGVARPLPPGVDLTAYRIIQEALTNVTKHAASDRARVNLTWGHRRISITVADDGVGVPPTPTSERPRGYGLIGMRERATAVGGQLATGSGPTGGFLVSTHLPVPAVADATRAGDVP